MNDLRYTDTNSADDSSGVTWGLQGHLLWIVLVGALLSVLSLLLLYTALEVALGMAALVSAAPFLLTLTYAVLKQTHPPGWDVDMIDGWLNGPGFAPRHLTAPPRSIRSHEATGSASAD